MICDLNYLCLLMICDLNDLCPLMICAFWRSASLEAFWQSMVIFVPWSHLSLANLCSGTACVPEWSVPHDNLCLMINLPRWYLFCEDLCLSTMSWPSLFLGHLNVLVVSFLWSSECLDDLCPFVLILSLYSFVWTSWPFSSLVIWMPCSSVYLEPGRLTISVPWWSVSPRFLNVLTICFPDVCWSFVRSIS